MLQRVYKLLTFRWIRSDKIHPDSSNVKYFGADCVGLQYYSPLFAISKTGRSISIDQLS